MWGQVPAEAKCVRFSGATVKTVKQYACWEPNSGPLNEQEVLWTTKHSSGLWFRTVNYWAFFQPVISLFRLYSLLYIFFSLNFFLRCWKSNSESLTCHTNALIHNGATNPGNGFLFLLERGFLSSPSWCQTPGLRWSSIHSLQQNTAGVCHHTQLLGNEFYLLKTEKIL